MRGSEGRALITPRQTRLLRVRTLRHFQRAIAETVARFSDRRPASAAVLTPTREAGAQLGRTLDAAGVDARPAVVVTRDAWYAWLRERAAPCPPLLTPVQREVVGRAAAADALAAGCRPPFRLRPGIVAALLAFYDRLRRNGRPVDAFERVMLEELEPSADLDRGARRLLTQTRFLVAAFRAYERRLDASSGLDEHRLRAHLLTAARAKPVSDIVVTVPDQAAHAAGLYPADFDLLARLPRLARITVIATDGVLDAGYRERLDDLLPGLVESRVEVDGAKPPAVVAPDPAVDRLHFVWRDREEELRGIAGQVRRTVGTGGRFASAAVVVQRPLPYLYLAPSVFAEAALPVRAGDALPLAVEPYAAAVDLVIDFAASGMGRDASVALLRSPHFRFETAGAPPAAGAIRALDVALSEAGDAGGRDHLRGCADEWRTRTGPRGAAMPALQCVLGLADELQPLLDRRPLGVQLAALRAFLVRHAPDACGDGDDRGRQARTRVWQELEALEAAYGSPDVPGGDVDAAETGAVVRRWIESRTSPFPSQAGGVHIVDVHAAAYGRFDDVFVAGLVESEWPARTPRDIFYPGGLLAALGWPRERDRQRASRAAFHDLLWIAAERVWLSTFDLEDDALVNASPLLEDLDGMNLDRCPAPGPAPQEETLSAPGAGVDAALARRWRALRTERAGRAEAGARRGDGAAGPQPAQPYTVSALERYAGCPFQYFASHRLDLEADPAAERTLTPERRGLFLHRVFESFFRDWQAAGHGAVTLANLDAALDRFAAVAEEAVGALPALDRAVAREWLLGSAAAPGLAERVFVAEVENQTGVVDRLLEYRIDGRFEIGPREERRTVALRGVVDRVDLHADRTFRVIDYKASRPPHPARALQLPVYAGCVERQLRGERGEDWRAVEALYLAFGDPRLEVSVPGGDVARAIAAGEARVLELVEAIEAGVYPPRPTERTRCASCAFPTVCRKDGAADAQ